MSAGGSSDGGQPKHPEAKEKPPPMRTIPRYPTVPPKEENTFRWEKPDDHGWIEQVERFNMGMN